MKKNGKQTSQDINIIQNRSQNQDTNLTIYRTTNNNTNRKKLNHFHLTSKPKFRKSKQD